MTTVKSPAKTAAAKSAKSTGAAPAGNGEQIDTAAIVAVVSPGDAQSTGSAGAAPAASGDPVASTTAAGLQSDDAGGAGDGAPQAHAPVIAVAGTQEGAVATVAPAPGAANELSQNDGGQQAADAHMSESNAATQRLDWQDAIVYGFEVSAMRDGFRRAGRAWMREPVFLTEDDITREQFDLLIDEPNIRIVPARRSASELGESQ